MGKKEVIQIFEERKVRTVWDDEQEKWYFCVADVVEALTDSVNPTDYIKKMKKRDPELAKGWGQIVTPFSVLTAGGKQRVNCTPQQGVFRIIQSIPSKKAEPFKQWMAQLGHPVVTSLNAKDYFKNLAQEERKTIENKKKDSPKQ